MKREDADKLYEANWKREYTTMEDLYQRINDLAKNGAYNLAVYVDSKQEYAQVYAKLVDNGYTVEDYSDGGTNIIMVTWG